ncbi:MAG: hypothetical protein ABIJ97_11590 [Bacteroidota bacterium]
MKKLKSTIIILLCLGIMFSLTSCLVFVKEDQATHKGWFKNSNNPHHPLSTNPGHSKHKQDKRK